MPNKEIIRCDIIDKIQEYWEADATLGEFSDLGEKILGFTYYIEENFPRHDPKILATMNRRDLLALENESEDE